MLPPVPKGIAVHHQHQPHLRYLATFIERQSATPKKAVVYVFRVAHVAIIASMLESFLPTRRVYVYHGNGGKAHSSSLKASACAITSHYGALTLPCFSCFSPLWTA